MANLKTAGRQAPLQALGRASDGEEMKGEECIPLLGEWKESLQQRGELENVSSDIDSLYTRPVAQEQAEKQTSADLSMAPTARELKRAMKGVNAGTAPGCDELLMSLIKALGPKVKGSVEECVAEVLVNARIPGDWKCSKVLWVILGELGMAEEDLELLQAIYSDVVAEAKWEGYRTRPLTIPRGFRQGCPLLPVPFMVYVAGVIQHLENSGCGYTIAHREGSRQVVSRIPTLVYADDFAVLAGRGVRLKVREVETATWQNSAATKSSLETYRGEKLEISTERFYNSKGSALLAETCLWRLRFTEGIVTTCALRGDSDETLGHVVLKCSGVLTPASTTALPITLGFKGDDGEVLWQLVELTKRRLEYWWWRGALRVY
ncbi:hypothetical protein HPB52_005182 [Rhipicephalus sanguineus]|uniref:Reverse transcriptase domain-containing protein n=1 Tax=Rhipicephalus sanguineus TaxID=34632 RepID=A0A9D4PZH5_RHISA|nr:hypothetical protein HPB52_005182 [Rhipicephalus sanguineus]